MSKSNLYILLYLYYANKVKRKVRKTNVIHKRKKTVLHYLVRYFISIVVVLILFVLLSPFVHTSSAVVCANTLSCQESLHLRIENNAIGIFNNHKFIPPKIDMTAADFKQNVLGVATASGEQHIYVDLTTQTLSAFQGTTLYMQVPISSGKWYPTPTGDYTIWEKIRATRMTGGSGADYYNLPNVPFVMFFSNIDVPESAGYSFHGAYWHDNFGHAMSHGCINMRITDAEKLYDWASPPTDGYTTLASTDNQGTKVTITGEAP